MRLLTQEMAWRNPERMSANCFESARPRAKRWWWLAELWTKEVVTDRNSAGSGFSKNMG